MGTSSSSSTISTSAPERGPSLDAIVAHLTEPEDEPARRRFLARCLADHPADELLAAIKQAAERQFATDAHTSLRLAEALTLTAEIAGRPAGRALGLLAHADALLMLGRYPESLALYEESRETFSACGDEVGWARTYTGWLLSSHYLGRGEEALRAVEPAYDVLARRGEWLRAAGLTQNQAAICYWIGRYDEALQLYNRAQGLFEELGAEFEDRAARSKQNKALILMQLGRFAAALVLYRQAREVFVRHGRTLDAQRAERNIARIHASQGDYTGAIQILGEARATLEQEGYESDTAWTALDIVETYLRLNRNTEAMELAEETIARFERCGTPTEAAKAKFACAQACLRLGQSDRAGHLLDEVVVVFGATGHTNDAALAALQRGALALDAEDWTGAQAEAERAWLLFDRSGAEIRRAQADLVRARALLGRGDTDGAARLATTVLMTAREREAPWLAPEGHHILARVARARGDQREALAACRAAIEAIEALQSRLAVELRANFLADKLQVYQEAIAHALRLARPEEAFALLERAKSRALVDYLAAHPEVRQPTAGAGNPGLADELARLRAEHDWLYRQLYGYRLGERPGGGGETEAEAAALRGAIRERERRIARLQERLALREAAGVLPTADPALARPPLDAGTLLLEYYFHDDGGLVFVVAERGLQVVELPASPGEIRRLLKRWQLNLDATTRAIAAGEPLAGLARNARGLLTALYRALLAPVESRLAGAERVVIVPYGATHQAPFHALFDGRAHLLERLEVATCPSSSLLRLCADRPRRGGGRALVVAYDDEGRLPFVGEEARAVAALLPGEALLQGRATRAALAASAPQHAIVHLAAHGEARTDNPDFAYLRLADGQLRATDVFNLDLCGALVTLSGCETGRGVVTGGDEVIGLSRGFLHAGATTVVQSLWRVEDASTAGAMAHFYGGLRAGRPVGAALRGAQRALLDEGRGEGHPFYWAPFQVIGDGERRWV